MEILTREQNLAAARIFLNIFDLTLEDTDKINEVTSLEIYNPNPVGTLNFTDNKITISVDSLDGKLEANYDFANIFTISTGENGLSSKEWSNNIKFSYDINNGVKLTGDFLIGACIDDEFGLTCLCQPLLSCEIADKEKVNISMFRNQKFFDLQSIKENYKEEISIDKDTNLIIHNISQDTNQSKTNVVAYSRYYKHKDEDENKQYLGVRAIKYKDGKAIRYNQQSIPAISDSQYDNFIQQCKMLHELDPSISNKIKNLQRNLIIHGVPVLDNIFNVCYDGYSNLDLQTIFNTEISHFTYQGYAENLKDSYFGISNDKNYFSISKNQKQLIKK